MIKHLIFLKIENMMDIKELLLQWFINFLIKISSGSNTSGGVVKSEIKSNQELAEELHKPIVRKFEKREVYSSFKYNIWGAALADTQLRSKFDKGFFFYYVSLTFIVNMHG